MKKVLFMSAAFAIAAQSHALIWGFAVPILDGSQEVPPNTSNAFGTASFTVNDLNFDIGGSFTVWNLTTTPAQPNTITAAHIHQAPVGVNGPVVFNLLGNLVAPPIVSGNMTTYVFRGTTSASVLTNLIAENAYINVHTTRLPGGEIRGQIDCMGVVPEPATIAALGLGIVPFLRKRRK
jgi:hypothetical protein